jgi:hypothetical protein
VKLDVLVLAAAMLVTEWWRTEGVGVNIEESEALQLLRRQTLLRR